MNPELPAHHADTRARAHAGARMVLAGIALNAVLTLVKFAAGIFGHTYALIADGTESLLDILASILVWTGFRVAARPPDANHPFGHGRAEPLAGLAVAGFIFLAAGVVAWHAVQRMALPHPVPHWFTLIVLAAIIVSKIFFSRRMSATGAVAGSTALGLEAWHHWADAMTSSAAFVGIAIAVVGGPKWAVADDWAALFACVIVTFNGAGMLKKALGEMMDAAVPEQVERDVRATAAAVTGVRALDKCRVRKSGLSHLVDIHVRVDGDLSVRAGHDIAHAVRDTLLASPLRITDVSVHIEPTAG